ncbi:MAG: hypothetical protein GX075_04910 [Firmicutes bacterium]|nr:hypothetical protein [Bacillota bacterium]
MRKVAWSRLTILRVIGISLLIMVMIGWWFKKDPALIGKFQKLVSPSDTVAPRKWVLESRKLYTMCGHTVSKRTEYQLEKPFKSVIVNHSRQIVKENDGLYVYYEENQDLCDSCLKNQFLGIEGQRIAVYRGTPDKPGPIMEKIALNLNKLPEAEIEDLKKGIPFKDGKEKLHLLEGLNGLSAE